MRDAPEGRVTQDGIAVRVGGVDDFAALGRRWRDLEQRADCSFFQTWTWTGCLVTERFPDPVLVEATDAGRTVALALFNRVGGRLYLGEAGSAALDSPYIEQNGVLTEAGREAELTDACLRAVARRRLVLSGVSAGTLESVHRSATLVRIIRHQPSPFADLRGGDYLARRSANTRQQIRRSDRFYQPLTLERAESVSEALAMLEAMQTLHQATWTARGQPGAFSTPFFGRFHRALIETAHPLGEVSLYRISSNKIVTGILYNFTFRKRMLAYQSGFSYGAAGPAAKPGLTCHHAAIQAASAQDIEFYDFLAGDDRYKRSLSDAATAQYWVESGPWWTPALLVRHLVARPV